MMLTISIIIPVYNADKYLKDCVQSVLSQGYVNWELILVNDGSTDNSRELCENFASADSRIFHLNQVNQGPSSARNLGLSTVHGDYILFIDSDDILLPNALQLYIDCAIASNADVIRTEFFAIDYNGKYLFHSPNTGRRKSFAKCIFSRADFLTKIIQNEFFLWVLMVKTCVAKKNGLSFHPEHFFMEDKEWICSMLSHAGSFVYNSTPTYAYRKHENSISTRITPLHFVNMVEIASVLADMGKKSSDIAFTESLYRLCKEMMEHIVVTIMDIPKQMWPNVRESVLSYQNRFSHVSLGPLYSCFKSPHYKFHLTVIFVKQSFLRICRILLVNIVKKIKKLGND